MLPLSGGIRQKKGGVYDAENARDGSPWCSRANRRQVHLRQALQRVAGVINPLPAR